MVSFITALIPLPEFCMHTGFLRHIKAIIQDSEDGHEQTAYALACELEELAKQQAITSDELAFIVGKAEDVLCYFRYDFDLLARDCSWYRAAVIHQMCCSMLQTMHLLRPDIYTNMLRESAYDLFFYSSPASQAAQLRPLTCKTW